MFTLVSKGKGPFSATYMYMYGARQYVVIITITNSQILPGTKCMVLLLHISSLLQCYHAFLAWTRGKLCHLCSNTLKLENQSYISQVIRRFVLREGNYGMLAKLLTYWPTITSNYLQAIPKGQQIWKENWRAVTSPKKQICSFVFWEKLRLDKFVSRSTDLYRLVCDQF